jgi:hypothetical protein
MGTVTEVAADHYTVKTETGETYIVHFSANTRILKQPARPAAKARRSARGGEGGERGSGGGGNPPTPIKSTDIKVGDAIAAMGEVDATAKSVGATMVMQIDPERAKQMREMQANYGKTWLMGKVTAIDGVKVTLMGAVDNTQHAFVADENTTFRKRRDPITLGPLWPPPTSRSAQWRRRLNNPANPGARSGRPRAPSSWRQGWNSTKESSRTAPRPFFVPGPKRRIRNIFFARWPTGQRSWDISVLIAASLLSLPSPSPATQYFTGVPATRGYPRCKFMPSISSPSKAA